MGTCLEWAYSRTEECNAWADNGYNECASWRKDCCDWWPCSWACEVVSWFCTAFVWISNVVCVGWTVITTAVCIVWDIVTTVINFALAIIEAFAGVLLSTIAAIIELLEAIPGLGALIRWVIGAVQFVGNTVASLGDAALGAIGIRPEKRLRVCTVVLQDEQGEFMATEEEVIKLLQLACDVYKRDANVRILPMKYLQIRSGFAGAERVTRDWITLDGYKSGSNMLSGSCNVEGFARDWGISGSLYQLRSTAQCFLGAYRRVLGYGAPITVFIIRNFTNPTDVGCSLFLTDYVLVAQTAFRSTPGSPRTLAHEVGHSCNLQHECVDDGVSNLMATQGACNPESTTQPDREKPTLTSWQVLKLRASKHVTYF